MAIISIEISDEQLQRVINGMCGAYYYQTDLSDPDNAVATIPNPETKAAFCKRMIKQHIKACALKYEGDKAKADAVTVAESEVDI